MTLQQIELFVKESVANEIKWERIRLLGGEPTLHPNFLEILDRLIAYRDTYSQDTTIEVITNGYGKKVESVLRRIPITIKIDNTHKKPEVQPEFNTFNVAPKDLRPYRFSDFRNACLISNRCGIGLSSSGYYPCAAAAGIDRIFGWNLGRQNLPKDDDMMHDMLEKFCSHCGHFKRIIEPPVTRPVMSSTWRAAYTLYEQKRPKLTQYGTSPDPS
jgi:hypothetical protein